MRILFCCEFYAPSVGGVQEVMRQVAERLVARGHEVTVATSKLPYRNFVTLNGVSIQEFDVSGNSVRGILGDQGKYQEYVANGNFDIVMIKAAQQWTFDALWPVLDRIRIPKVFIPCGFSGLYELGYAEYFRYMPVILKKFDQLIFYASDYRDINFAREHGITHFSVIPNGASEIEFNVPADPGFRVRNGIKEDAFLFLTVGSLTGLKGHQELAEAFEKMNLPEGKRAVLLLNGNHCDFPVSSAFLWLRKTRGLVKTYGLFYTIRHVAKRCFWSVGLNVGKSNSFKEIAIKVNRSSKNKKILLANLPRKELIQAYIAADLFVFASNVEYSPLVLFESAAAGTPFLTVDVGNAREICQWTACGEMCPSHKDEKGYTRVDTDVLASKMENMMSSPEKLARMGEAGRKNWEERYTWQTIAAQYEKKFENLLGKIS